MTTTRKVRLQGLLEPELAEQLIERAGKAAARFLGSSRT